MNGHPARPLRVGSSLAAGAPDSLQYDRYFTKLVHDTSDISKLFKDGNGVTEHLHVKQQHVNGLSPVNVATGSDGGDSSSDIDKILQSDSQQGTVQEPRVEAEASPAGNSSGNAGRGGGACVPGNGGLPDPTPEEIVQARIAEIQAAMTEEETGRTTYAVAHVTTWLRDELWIAGAGRNGFVRTALRGGALNMKSPAPGDLSGLKKINDAEMHLLRSALRQGATINAIGATRDVCLTCQARLQGKAPIVTPLEC